jgi:hypothetical protein
LAVQRAHRARFESATRPKQPFLSTRAFMFENAIARGSADNLGPRIFESLGISFRESPPYPGPFRSRGRESHQPRHDSRLIHIRNQAGALRRLPLLIWEAGFA